MGGMTDDASSFDPDSLPRVDAADPEPAERARARVFSLSLNVADRAFVVRALQAGWDSWHVMSTPAAPAIPVRTGRSFAPMRPLRVSANARLAGRQHVRDVPIAVPPAEHDAMS